MNGNLRENIFNLHTLLYAIALLITLSLSWNTVKVIERNYTLEQEVDALEEEVAILALENQNLTFNIEYFKTDEYLEIAAKEKFNKRGAGEQVAIFERDEFVPSTTSLVSQQKPEDEQRPEYQENLRSWWDFIFGSQAS